MSRKPKSKTLRAYRGWRAGKYGLYGVALLAPEVPAGVITAVKWDEWFGKAGWSLPWGLAFMLMTVIIGFVGVLLSGKIIKRATIALFILAAFLAFLGVTCLFLARILTEMGYMWLWTALGVAGSATSLIVEEQVVDPNVELYKGLIDKNVLSRKAKRREARIKRAEEEAARERAEREGAVE